MRFHSNKKHLRFRLGLRLALFDAVTLPLRHNITPLVRRIRKIIAGGPFVVAAEKKETDKRNTSANLIDRLLRSKTKKADTTVVISPLTGRLYTRDFPPLSEPHSCKTPRRPLSPTPSGLRTTLAYSNLFLISTSWNYSLSNPLITRHH